MLLKRKPVAPPIAAPELQERLYVVGDVHGCDHLLEPLLAKIDADLAADPTDAAIRLVFVGDYIDRGEGSAQVVARLMELLADPALNVTCLKGNHEVFLEAFLENPEQGAAWLDHGGLETLASYKVPQPLRRRRERDFQGLAQDLAERLGAHRRFYADLPLTYRSGNIFISHAGAEPDRPLSAQEPHALLWGDRRFLEVGGPAEAVVIHGHWACEQVDFGPNRIGVDTGAFLSGRLTALKVDRNSGYAPIST